MAIRIAHNNSNDKIRPFGHINAESEDDLYLIEVSGNVLKYINLDGSFRSLVIDSGVSIETVMSNVSKGVWVIVPKDYVFGKMKYQILYYDNKTEKYRTTNDFYFSIEEFYAAYSPYHDVNEAKIIEGSGKMEY